MKNLSKKFNYKKNEYNAKLDNYAKNLDNYSRKNNDKLDSANKEYNKLLLKYN